MWPTNPVTGWVGMSLQITTGNEKNYLHLLMFSRKRRTWLFQVVHVWPRTVKRCTKINARAQPLFCSLTRLFIDVLMTINVVFAYSTNCSKSIEKPRSSASGPFIEKLIITKNVFYILFSIMFSFKLFYIVYFTFCYHMFIRGGLSEFYW